MTHTISVYDNATGKTVTREMNAAEQAAHDIMLEEHAETAAEEAAVVAAKESAQAKLAALGLTADEIAAL